MALPQTMTDFEALDTTKNNRKHQNLLKKEHKNELFSKFYT